MLEVTKPIIMDIIDKTYFITRIKVDDISNCWLWTGSMSSTGYGIACFNREYYRAHRISYFMFNGKISQDLVIDHMCRNKQCVNPDHLREVTQEINSLENNSSPFFENSKKTHCKRGHGLFGENLNIRYTNGKIRRECVFCSKESKRKSWLKRKEKLNGSRNN